MTKILLVTLVVFILTIFLLRPINKHWLEILRFRNNYAFYDLWSTAAWRNLLLFILPGLSVFFLSKGWMKEKKLFSFLLSGIGILSVLHIFFVLLYPQWWIIVLQIGRAWIYVVYLSLLLLAGLIAEKVQKLEFRIGLMIVLGLGVVLFNTNYRVSYRPEEWIDTQRWAHRNTEKGCIFLTPFYISGFRVDSERGIVGDIKDGTLSFYSEKFASEWNNRYLNLSSWESYSSELILQMQKKYKFNYLVVTKPSKFDWPLKYENGKFAVYFLASSNICKES